MEKIDGSCLIISRYKGNFIIRTRGTVDAFKNDNGSELDLLWDKYPRLFLDEEDTWNYSLILEWKSLANRVVIRHEKTDFVLIGCVYHEDYRLSQQPDLDVLAKTMGVPRPETLDFDNIPELIEKVKEWKGKEGVCLYSNQGQDIHKIKAAAYLVSHRLKEEFRNFDRVLEFYVAQGCPEYQDFYDKVVSVVDFEVAETIRGEISRCVDASKEVRRILDGMERFVAEKLLTMGDPSDKKTRGRMAQLVLAAYPDKAGFVFQILDGKKIDNDGILKLFYQVIKAPLHVRQTLMVK